MAPSLVLALLAASASACPPPSAGLTPTQEARLAQHFAPTLAYHPDERYFPVDPLTTGRAGGEVAPDASLEPIAARTARYLALQRPDRTAMSVVYYRVTARPAPGRCRLAVEYFFYYLGNPYRSRGGVIPIRFDLWHPHDLERLLVLVEFPPDVAEMGARPDLGRVTAVYPSAHGDSMPDNIRHARDPGGLGLPLRVMVELGSHAMALDTAGSGLFVPGVSADGPRKFTWGIRDRGAPWAWYREGDMDARGAAAIVLAPSAYQLRPAAALAAAFDIAARAEPSGDRNGRPSWAVRSFGEAKRETLLRVPDPVRNPDAAYGERTAARRERGFLMAASNLLSQFSFLAGGRWLVATPSLLPDVLVDAEGVLTYDGRFYTLVDVLATYRLDFATRVFAGGGPLVRWWSTGPPELEWEWVAGVEFRLGRLHGVTFATASDSEVIVEAYKALGCECFRRFNGPWAIAIYDAARRRLVLSRDRIGKRPLYWTRIGPLLAFASEIKALMALPGVAAAKAVNEAAIDPFLRKGQRDLDDLTCFAGIASLPAASCLVVDEHFPRDATRYWQLPAERLADRAVGVDEAVRAVRGALDDAVRIRLRADVPWAADLSGGLDSSAVVALAARHASAPPATYSVTWPEPRLDEAPFARRVAGAAGTRHRELRTEPRGFWREVEAFTATEEEPYHSPNLFTSQQVRRQMRDDGIKMYLNGAGGDEVFAGYRVHFRAMQADALRQGRLGRFGAGPWRWSERPGVGASLIKPPFDVVRGAPGLAALLREDMLRTRMPYWLRSGDKAHMAVPIESRSPLLDYRVLELAFSLPLTLLLRDGWHKWVLRKAVEDLLPADVVWRRRKQGFPFPYARFFRDSREQVSDIRRSARNQWVGGILPPGRGERRWRHVSWLLWYAHEFSGDRALFARLAGGGPASAASREAS